MAVCPLLSFSQRKSGSLSVPEAVKYWQVSKLNVSASLTNSQSKGRCIPIAFSETRQLRARETGSMEIKAATRHFPKCCLRLCINAGDRAGCTSSHTCLQKRKKSIRPVRLRLFFMLWNPMLVVILLALGSDKELWWGGPGCSCLCFGSGGAGSSSLKFLSLPVV